MSKTVGDLTVVGAIVCEDIRQETGKKLSLLGVFSGDILVRTIPANLRVALYLATEASAEVDIELFYRLRLNEEELLTAQGRFKSSVGKGAIPFPSMVVAISQPGVLHFEIGADGKDWVEVATKNVSVGPVD